MKAAARPEGGSGTLTLQFLEGAVSSGWQALNLDGGFHLRIGAEVNGQTVLAILDTGAARTVLDRNFATQIGAALRPGFRVSGMTASVDGALAEGVTVKIGSMTVSGISAAVLDLSELERAGGGPIAVVLGREFFEHSLVELDLPNRRAAFLTSAAKPADLGGQTLPLRSTAGGSRQFPVSLDGKASTEAIFDLGCSAPILISPDYAERTNLLSGRRISDVLSVGAEGASLNRVATLDRLQVGDIDLYQIPVELPSTWNRTADVVIGLPVLGRFDITCDYGRDLIRLMADPRMIQAAFPKDRSGIGAQRLSDGFQVMHVAAGSPAMSAGLRVGDKIVTVNGDVIGPQYFQNNPSIGTRPVGTELLLGLSDGRYIRMTLEEYY